jgi:hypothetical protein
MNIPRTMKLVASACLVAVLLFAFTLPRDQSLPGGYTYSYFPAGGQRYIIAPGGIKKVGQEVLDYQVDGAIISGTVRSELGGAEVRTFRLDTTTHQVTRGEPIDTHAR